MTTGEKFVKYHWKSTLFLGFLVIAIMGFEVVIEDTDWLVHKNNKAIVLGEAVEELETDNDRVENIEYQNELRLLLKKYINRRSEFETESQDWVFLAGATKAELLDIPVPLDYKDLHTYLAFTFDLEKEAVISGDKDKMGAVNDRWERVLDKYYWINY